TIKDLKQQFSRYFPYLRLAFYKDEAELKNGSTQHSSMSDEVCLSEIKTLKKEGFFQLDAATVAAFEKKMQEEFGLLIKIYRKAGVMWLKTTGTDNLSLEKQNKMGEVASRPFTFNLNNLFL
ncbi:MAG TPA: hypothetical protein VGE06_06125, partial [Flavisolibacter sp.]